jgi:single-strand DNA-binding protein
MSANITIVGRLGADPELRFSNSGMAIAKLRVVSSKRKKEGDDWVDVDTTWWSVTAFKNLAENVTDNLVKGDSVVIAGAIKSREWEDVKTGEKRSIFEVTAEAIGKNLALVKRDGPKLANGYTPSPSDDPWASKPSTTDEPPF